MIKYLLLFIFFFLTFQIKAQTVSDIDGNIYNTVTIGTQTWLKENLKTTKFNDGTAIPNIISSIEWISLATPAYCWNSNDAVTYKATYGALYNWYTVSTSKLCPTGWHVPTNIDWSTLTTYLGGAGIAGGKLKEAGMAHWKSPNQGADNSSGFTGLPGGFRDAEDVGNFHIFGSDSHLWSISEENSTDAWSILLAVFVPSVNLAGVEDKRNGCSVRCLKDITTSINISGASDSKFIYPNPANDRLYIKHDNYSNTYVMIYDLQGKKIINIQIDSEPLDISNLSKGIYLVKIIDKEVIIFNKLIKK